MKLITWITLGAMVVLLRLLYISAAHRMWRLAMFTVFLMILVSLVSLVYNAM